MDSRREEIMRLKVPAPLDRVLGALTAVGAGASLNAQVEYGRNGYLIVTEPKATLPDVDAAD